MIYSDLSNINKGKMSDFGHYGEIKTYGQKLFRL